MGVNVGIGVGVDVGNGVEVGVGSGVTDGAGVDVTVGVGALLGLLACCLCRRPREQHASPRVAPAAKRAARPEERVRPVEVVEVSDDEDRLAVYVPRRRQ